MDFIMYFKNGGVKILNTGTADDPIIYCQEHIVNSKIAIKKKNSDFFGEKIIYMGFEQEIQSLKPY